MHYITFLYDYAVKPHHFNRQERKEAFLNVVRSMKKNAETPFEIFQEVRHQIYFSSGIGDEQAKVAMRNLKAPERLLKYLYKNKGSGLVAFAILGISGLISITKSTYKDFTRS